MAVIRHATISAPRAWRKGQFPPGAVEIDWSHQLARGLRAYWPLSGAPARDIAGGNDGAITGAAIVGSQRGPVLSTGSTGYVDLGSSFAGTTSMSVVAWINAASFPNNYNSVFTRSNGGDTFSQLLVKSDGKLAIYADGGQYDDTGSYTLPTNTWYCVAAVWDEVNGLAGYVNGAVDGTSSSSALRTNSVPAQIGSDPGISGRVWSGQIGPVMLYGRALSAGEVAWLFAEPAAMVRPVVRRPLIIASTVSPLSLSARGGAGSQARALSFGRSSVAVAAAAKSRQRASPTIKASVSARATARAVGRAAPSSLSSVAAAARGAAISAGRAAGAGLVAAAARATASARGISAATGLLTTLARLPAVSALRAAPFALVGLAAQSAGRVAGRASLSSVGFLIAKTGAVSSGRAGASAAAVTLFARTAARATGSASLSGISFVISAARAGAMSTGRSAGAMSAGLVAASRAGGLGRAGPGLVASLAARAQARSGGTASLSGITYLATAAAAAAKSAGRGAARLLVAGGAVARGKSAGVGQAKAAASLAGRRLAL